MMQLKRPPLPRDPQHPPLEQGRIIANIFQALPYCPPKGVPLLAAPMMQLKRPPLPRDPQHPPLEQGRMCLK